MITRVNGTGQGKSKSESGRDKDGDGDGDGDKDKDKDKDKSSEPVLSREVCELVAENFVTVTPSLNMDRGGYGWNASILSALLDEVVERFSGPEPEMRLGMGTGDEVDADRIHVTGFSMGGYETVSYYFLFPSFNMFNPCGIF